ncbi:hypothetical protein DM01DRAFT_1287552 [Hesseltinella vesiculosa]|uniref:Snf7-domain-containing protein n=1 Tax=Hesseltinella vesiculosa TaxID=101127 RepID=A0A1X2GGW3_9FUNG|nr:hypothetical protein DM01DRAFT_1287552 [Hesseltinella vesiculosa]
MSWFQHRLKPSASRNSVYVVIPTVRSIASDIRNKFNAQPVKSYTNTLLTLSDFRKHYGTYRHRSLTDLDLHLILKYMASQNMIALDNVVQDNKNQMVIKFIEPGMPNEIKDNEKAMISIRTTCDTLHLQIDRLQSRFEQLTTEAKSQHDLKHKPQALSSLKRRKQVLDMLSKRLGTLETVEGLLLKMESAKDDLQILQAFDQGANALRNMLSDQVSLEAVEDTMSKIHEAYADQQDVEQSMTQGMKSLDAVDDDDEEALLKELQELELESASAEDQQPASPASSPKLDSLPAPPTATPVPSSQNQERLDDDKTPTPNRVPVVE